ncbi:ATP-binding protein [Dactylosporangium sp. NPDC051541]|uniref:ATP-binding protein n=1 Tax=Dactylosporangium sp. NPDC051541 TaxID=3363977 RepID=UPI00379E05B1
MTAPAFRDNLEHLAAELIRLDMLIRLLLDAADRLSAAAPQAQANRAMYITRDEVEWLLTTGPAAEVGAPGGRPAVELFSAELDARVRRSLAAGVELRLPLLGRLFGLSELEQLAVLVCLAPELRRKYDRLYAYLQDDITRRRPSVDLALELLCPTERQRWAARGVFGATATLLRAGILRTVDDPQSPSGSSGLAQFLALDPRICQFLLGIDQLAAPLAGHARWVPASSAPPAAQADPATTDRLVRLAGHSLAGGEGGRGLVCYLHGPAGALELAEATCRRLGVGLVSLDLATLGADAEELLRLALREGLLCQAAVHVAGADLLLQDAVRPMLASLTAGVSDFGWLVFLSGESPWTAVDAFAVAPVEVSLPDPDRSAALWRQHLAGYTTEAAAWADNLAARFRLPPATIQAAVRLADDQRLMDHDGPALTLADVSAACRHLSNQNLRELATVVHPRYGWADLVLPADRVAALHDICDQVRHHHRVFHSWGFGAKVGHGRGLSALLTGPPGTGKTMAVEVMAADLGLDVYKVDLSGVVSKYIGETEKNLARVFAQARSGNAVLFFDEADALFGKRTEVSDAHDRYANIETSYLLQKMEEFEGLVVLATNLRQNLDEAFTRRVRFIVEFPFPDADSRRRIWRTLVPPAAPVAVDVDFAALGHEFAVAGGSIKNIVLNAAFFAAADGGVIDRRHILNGTRREFQKIGKLWPYDSKAVPS